MSKKDRRLGATPPPDKVIHVVFGPGGGRIDPPARVSETRETGKRSSAADDALEPPPSSREPVSDLFTMSEVGKLLQLSTGRLRSLDKNGIVSPTGRQRGHRAYTFQDIIALKAGSRPLAEEGSPPRRDARDREHPQGAPESDPAALRAQHLLRWPGGRAPLLDGLLRADERADAARLRGSRRSATMSSACSAPPPGARAPRRPTTSTFARASSTKTRRRSTKRSASTGGPSSSIPWLAIAYTNLGNICFRRGDEPQAEKLYKKALLIDPTQPEAQYNLGYVMLERG